MHQPQEWRPLAEQVSVTCQQVLPGVIGVYVHGSAAMGGMTDRSDLDVLVVTADAAGVDQLGGALLALTNQGRPLELSVVTAEAAYTPAAPWPFLVHVNSSADEVVFDDGAGDADLVAHYAITRARGVTILGPPPATVIGAISRVQFIGYLVSELEWGLRCADQRYAVLNACRAVGFASTGRLLSKVEGAQWWIQNRGASPLVAECLLAQQSGHDLGPCTDVARRFVAECSAELRRSVGLDRS